jgi:hypothetical protein
MNKRFGRRLAAVVLGLVAVAFAAAAAGTAGVDPPTYTASLDPGSSVTITKTVHTPPIAPKPDIYFLSDTTGSMGPAIANVQTNASTIMTTVGGSTSSPMFGAGDYKDFEKPQVDPYAFRNDASIGTSAGAQAGIATWAAGGGVDGPEAQLYALHEIATDPAIGWRSDSTRILVWFGDAPGHDPICAAMSGLATDLTTSSVAAELAAANIEVIAIGLNTGGYATGLNANSTTGEFGYDATCGPPSPVTGEATTITGATGGLDLFAANPSQVSTQILNGLQNLPVTVAGNPSCDSGLSVSLSPSSQNVTSGDDAVFSETISVDPGATQGATLTCQVPFTLNGLDAGPDFTQTVTIHVNDVTAPSAQCLPTTNPSGGNIPPAGGVGHSGQNPDGFYQMLFSDNVGVASAVLRDSGSSFSVDVANGEKDKLTQAPGGKPNWKPGPGMIDKKVTTRGDAFLEVTDTSGNVTDVWCRVPPPPK